MPLHEEEEEDKPCRACSDFKTWAKKQNKTSLSPPKQQGTKDCPLDKEELGKTTWSFLHTMVSYYPEKATTSQANEMSTFFNIFSQFYPCETCAEDFAKDIKEHPPKAATRKELEQWLCERHNVVNLKLGKPVFDCSKVTERWKDGWLDGSCD